MSTARLGKTPLHLYSRLVLFCTLLILDYCYFLSETDHDVKLIFSSLVLRLVSKSQQRIGLTFLKTTIMFQITVCNLQCQEEHNIRPEKGSRFDQNRQWCGDVSL